MRNNRDQFETESESSDSKSEQPVQRRDQATHGIRQRKDSVSLAPLRKKKRRTPYYPGADFYPGVYVKRQSVEARLDLVRLKAVKGYKPADLEPSGMIYLGVRNFDKNNQDDLDTALHEAARSVDRLIIKIMSDHGIPTPEYQSKLNFPSSSYIGDTEDEKLREQLTTLEYAAAIISEAAKRAPDGRTKLKGVHKRRKGGLKDTGLYTYEARIHSVKNLSIFGNYRSEAEAISAFDIGTILVRGPEKPLNRPLTEYMKKSRFHEGLKVPRRVIDSVQKYLNSMPESTLEAELTRIRSYFPSGPLCPFYDIRERCLLCRLGFRVKGK